MKERRKLKELLQTPEEIMEALKGLIFAKNDVQPLIDGSTNKMVSSTNEKHANFFFIIFFFFFPSLLHHMKLQLIYGLESRLPFKNYANK